MRSFGIACGIVALVACGARTDLGGRVGGAGADAAPSDASHDAPHDASGDALPPIEGPELALGAGHSCAIMPDRTARCWGANGFAQLGDGTKQDRHNPVAVARLSGVAQISAGETHTCARDTSGGVYCWGENHVGQIGNGQACPPNDFYCSALSPSQVASIDGISVAAGGIHSCAVASNHHIHCWGYGQFGGLGDGTHDNTNVPVEVLGITTAVTVAAGWTHTCAASSNGHAWCWGLDEVGEIGNGTVDTGNGITTPQDVTGLTGVVQLALGWFFSCALVSGGGVECWGMNSSGQLGDGTMNDRSTAAPVAGLNDVAEISAREDMACARRNAGDVWCWGNGDPVPKPVAGVSQATSMGSGSRHACARVGTQVECWGSNSNGQLGDGTTVDHVAPALVVW